VGRTGRRGLEGAKGESSEDDHPDSVHPGIAASVVSSTRASTQKELIINEWDNVQRIIVSLALKATTQSTIVSKLSAYARNNRTKRALWEYDNIIQSLYLLNYIDSAPLRQNVQRAVNRGENYHQLRRAVSYANFGKLLGPKGFRDDLMSSVRYHRILRRGREYGFVLSAAKALAFEEPDDQERGLHFICLNANIVRQFEFLQNAWIASTKFSGLTGESDPLLGNREPIRDCPVTSDFNMPQDGGLRRRVSGLPRFVTVRGGAYFFLPSIRALRYFAGA
jgi:Tn3 transposase DDE domain